MDDATRIAKAIKVLEDTILNRTTWRKDGWEVPSIDAQRALDILRNRA